jgi:mRNA-degrading endonuclease toxin of MazEF toxin-antitoxin module
LILLDQLRTLDQRRLIKKAGEVSAATLSACLAALQRVFAE